MAINLKELISEATGALFAPELESFYLRPDFPRNMKRFQITTQHAGYESRLAKNRKESATIWFTDMNGCGLQQHSDNAGSNNVVGRPTAPAHLKTLQSSQKEMGSRYITVSEIYFVIGFHRILEKTSGAATGSLKKNE